MVERDFSYSVVGISLFLHRVGEEKVFFPLSGAWKVTGRGRLQLVLLAEASLEMFPHFRLVWFVAEKSEYAGS